MKTPAVIVALASIAGCRGQTAATFPHPGGPGSPASSVENRRFVLLTRGVLTGEQFAEAILGTWTSAWSRPSGRRVEELSVRPDGTARAVIVGGGSREEYEGRSAFSLEYPYDPHSITFARLVIRPDRGPGITLSRINFGHHNAVRRESGPFLRIDGNPVGSLTGVMKRVGQPGP